MRGLRFAAPFLLALLFVARGSGRSNDTAADYTPPAPPPAEYQAHYDELSQKLTTFEAQIDAAWDGSIGDGQFAGALASANGNKAVGLLAPATWTRTLEMLDAYEAMGVEMIKLDVNYPVLTPAFHTYLAAHPPAAVPNYVYVAQNFIGTPNSFYNKLAAEIRSRGLGLWIEHGTLFTDYSPTPPGAYFADMRTAGIAATQTRYTQERSAEAAQIVAQLKPDYFSVLEEPTTQNDNFGYFPGQAPLFDPDGWTGYVHAATAAIAAADTASTALIGAGIGTWDSTEYLTRLAPLTDLDFFDMHIYPLQSLTADYLQKAIDWADYVRSVSPDKLLTIGEAWAYKTTAAEVSGGLNYNTIFGRDVYSFWEPIDRQFLDVLYKLTQYKDFSGVMPFWSQYYFAYLTYGDPALNGLGPIDLIAAAGAQAQQNWATMTLTGTGERFQELLVAAQDADSDSFPDAVDNCPVWANPTQALPNWSVPPGDSDCDGYHATVFFGAHAPESSIGTAANKHCAATPTTNDEALPDAWPPDFNDDQIVTGSDLLAFSAVFGSSAPGPPYNVRFDLNADGIISGSDVLQLGSFFGKRCAP